MENQIKTVEEIQQEIKRLKVAEVDYKGRVNNYGSMIETLQKFKQNCQDEYYNIRQEIRDNQREIALMLCLFKTGDRYMVNKIVHDNIDFFQIKIEGIRFDFYNSTVSETLITHTMVSLKGKSSITNKWRILPSMSEQELQSIIINKASC